MSDFLLSKEQVEQFNADGYLFVPKLFEDDIIQLLLDVARADKAVADAGGMADASGMSSKILLRDKLADDIYSAFVHSPRIVDPMEQLLGGEVYQLHHKMMLKEPRVGGAWEWHQDYGYWYNDTILFPQLASCMIAVDRASKANGCLQVLRGSHLLGRMNHGSTGGQTGADPDRVQWSTERLETVYCEMEPGTAVFFHCNTLHRSDQNRSENSRWSLICCYNRMSNPPVKRRGHGEPLPIERWDDNRIRTIGKQQLEQCRAASA